MDNSEIKYSPVEKIKIYLIAKDLFNKGFSHPQVLEKLIENNYAKEIATIIADKAFREEWDELFSKAKDFYAEGKTYPEVMESLKRYEEDEELRKYITDGLYSIKTVEMENAIESPVNIFEGIKWVIISAVGIPVVFLLRLSLASKIIWILVFVAATIQYLWGLRQRNISKKIKKFMENE